ISTAPMPDPEASVSKINFSVKLGSAKTGAADIAIFNCSKALLASSFHSKESFFNKAVSGAARVE
ncbi:hypothetical protein A2U01_0074916, partial [Trifolium medium]|nr:hypothetical protein [Trifolium medium]